MRSTNVFRAIFILTVCLQALNNLFNKNKNMLIRCMPLTINKYDRLVVKCKGKTLSSTVLAFSFRID